MLKILKIVIICLFQISLQSKEIELDLKDFAKMVSIENKINIVISDEITNEDKIFFIINKDVTKRDLFNIFQSMLSKKELVLIPQDNYFLINKIENEDYFSYKLKNLVENDLKDFFELHKIEFDYLSNSNTIIYKTTYSKKLDIEKILFLLDKEAIQKQIKITVFETDLTKVNDRGFEIKSFTSSQNDKLGINYFLDLVTLPYTVSSIAQNESKLSFYALLKFLDENKITEIKSSPFMLIKNNKEIVFKVVKNVPYLTTNTSTTSTQNTTNNSYSYKDVGLQILIKSKIYKNITNLDLSLILEDLIDSSTTPTTSKKELKTNFDLKDNEILILSGITKEVITKNDYSFPFISKIPVLGELFKYEGENKTNKVLTIAIEVKEGLLSDEVRGTTKAPLTTYKKLSDK